VILIVRHDATETIGVILNQRLAEHTHIFPFDEPEAEEEATDLSQETNKRPTPITMTISSNPSSSPSSAIPPKPQTELKARSERLVMGHDMDLHEHWPKKVQ